MDPGVRDGRVYAALLHGQDTGHGVGAAGVGGGGWVFKRTEKLPQLSPTIPEH